GFFYSPATVINLTLFGNHLFCRPRYHHYYFGDYYAANFVGLGFYPWFSVQAHKCYDPFWAHERWHHRRDRDWARTVEANYRQRRDDKNARPPHTWADAKALAVKGGSKGDKSQILAASLEQVAKNKEAPVRLQSLDKQTREKLADRKR